MKKAWPLSQILLLGSIVVAIVAVVMTIIITNTTLRSVEKNLPNTLINELVSLDLVLEHLSEVVSAAHGNEVSTTPRNFDRLAKKVDQAFKSAETLRQTYVFDNLVQASAFHAVVAPAIADLQIWLSEGISGYGPRSRMTAEIILSRISAAFEKAKTLNRQSRLNAQNKLDEERDRLDRFLGNVNQMFMLTLFITFLMVFLFIRQHLFKAREMSAQKVLQTQRDLLNSLFENILLGITVWRSDGTFLFSNAYFTHLTGYTAGEIKNTRDWFTKAYPDPTYRAMVMKKWKEFTDGLDTLNDFKVTCRDGQVKDIEFRNTFLPDGRVLVSLADITDRKRREDLQRQAEKALQKSEEQYRAVVENTPDLIYRTDLNGVIIFISSSVHRLSGYTVEEAIGMKMAEEIYAFPKERQQFLTEIKKHGLVRNFEARLKRKDGSVWWAATNAHFFKDADGTLLGIEGVTRDITDTKQAEAAVKESEQRMRAILEASPDPMIMYSNIGHPQYINPSFTEVFGWTLDDLKEKPIPFVPRDQEQITAEKIKEIYTRRIPLKFETRRYTKDRRTLDILLSASVTQGNDGEPTGLVVNLTDITERKALETQYEQAQKMEALGTLAGGIAHDFNNLISGIFGYLDLARKKTKEPLIKEYLAKALNTSERARGLTHQLLTFSKGGAPIKKIESLVPFLQETALFALSGANVSCSFDLPSDLWACDCDINQIAQVIDNLIINAQHAMPSGGYIQMTAANTTVTGKERPGLVPGRYVKISITDTGTGIPEKYISRVFDPFFTTKQKGSGLGLATSYSIIKRHGGIIEIESEPGAGSTFHTFLPAAADQTMAEEPLTEKKYQGSGRILIMDDEEMIQEILVDMVETMGFQATSQGDGRSAVEAFEKAIQQNTPFTAVILDLTVPGGMGGKETVKELRKRDRTIPIFVASGYSEDAAIADPQAFGFTASLEKPFVIAQLSRMFEKYL